MRFLGGGVGHGEQAAPFSGVPNGSDASHFLDADSEPELAPTADNEDESPSSDEEDPDRGYAASDGEEEEDGEEDEEPDLGPEDGEGDNTVDEYDSTQYAQC